MNQQVGNIPVFYYASDNSLIGQGEISLNNNVVDVANGYNDYLVTMGQAQDVYICQIKIHQVQRPPIFNQNTQQTAFGGMGVQNRQQTGFGVAPPVIPGFGRPTPVIPGLGLQPTRPNIEEEWNRWFESERRRQQAGGVMPTVTIPGIPQYPTGFKMPITVDVIVPLDLSIERFRAYTFSQLLRGKEIDRMEVRTVPLRCGLSAVIQ